MLAPRKLQDITDSPHPRHREWMRPNTAVDLIGASALRASKISAQSRRYLPSHSAIPVLSNIAAIGTAIAK
jgi:hypothetical protein